MRISLFLNSFVFMSLNEDRIALAFIQAYLTKYGVALGFSKIALLGCFHWGPTEWKGIDYRKDALRSEIYQSLPD
jgi:hypothetical protein